MKYARILEPSGRVSWVRWEGERILRLREAPYLGEEVDGEVEGPHRLLAPATPSKIVCVGKNYAKHAAEMNSEVPPLPLLFMKPPSALVGPDAPIELPSQSERVEHEAALGVVIGRRMKHVPEHEALDYVFGYVVRDDVTARDLQRSDVQFTRAKGFDTFCPVGPHIETQLDPTDARIELDVDGVLRQQGTTADMVYPVARLLAFISSVMTLEPGDLIATGTPEGVGPLVDGNVVRVRIAGIGELRNPVVRAR